MTDDLGIEVIRKDDLRAGTLDRITAMCTCAYEEDFAAFMKAFSRSVHVLAWLGSDPVSHALWVTRWLQPGDSRPLRTAYVEAVATEPTFQGRGFATAVMRQLADSIIDYQLGGLSPCNPSFYRRFGWELWQGALFIRKDDGLLPTPEDEQIVILRLPATPELDMTACLSAEWREGELW